MPRANQGAFDITTNAQQLVNYAHKEIHYGNAYQIWATDSDLDNGSDLIVAFTTEDSTTWVHLDIMWSVTGSATFDLLEAPTITVDTGSDVTIYNRNRNSTNTSILYTIETIPEQGKATKNPAITLDGTCLHQEVAGGTKNTQAGSGSDQREHVLKQNTTYAVRINSEADNNRVTMILNWYEHSNIENP